MIINLDEKKKSNVHDIIKKIKQNPIKRNIEINQQIKNQSNIKIEDFKKKKIEEKILNDKITEKELEYEKERDN